MRDVFSTFEISTTPEGTNGGKKFKFRAVGARTSAMDVNVYTHDQEHGAMCLIRGSETN